MNMPEGKKPEKDDPFELKGVAIDGDPEVMIRCMIEEFARMGWTAERILQLFRVPNYQVPHKYYKKHGEERVKKKIKEVLGEHGVFQFNVEVNNETEEACNE